MSDEINRWTQGSKFGTMTAKQEASMLKAVFRFSLAGMSFVAASVAAQQTSQPPPRPGFDSGAMHELQRGRDRFFQDKRVASGSTLNKLDMSREERKLLSGLEKKSATLDAAGSAAFAEAALKIQSPGARYYLGALQLEWAARVGNVPMQSAATDMTVDSGLASTAQLPLLLRNQGIFALDSNNMPKAETAFGRLVGLTPADADATVNLAQIKLDVGKPQEALSLFETAIRLKRTANLPVPEIWLQAERAARAKATGAARR